MRFLENVRMVITVLVAVVTLAVFAREVRNHAFLMDDAFISFRYSLNLAQGEGLVWNPGERVEGYTNLLWVLLIAAGLRLGAPPEIVSQALGIASGLALLGALAAFGARRAGWRSPLVVGVPLVLVLNRSFTAWCTSGMATMFFTLLAFLAFAAFLREREDPARLPVASSLLFALTTLTRPDGILFTFVAGAFFLGEVLAGRRSLRRLGIWLAPYVALVGGHFLWRKAYYGFWLPNTFYAKVNGTWTEHGITYFSSFLKDYEIAWFLPLLFLPLVLRRRYEHFLFLALIAGYLSYLLMIGGDFFEFRFLVFLFPYAFWLMAEGLRLLPGVVSAPWGRTGLAAASFAVWGALLFAIHQGSAEQLIPLDKEEVAPLSRLKSYCARRIWEGKYLRSYIDAGVLPEDIILCVGGAGALPYYTRWTTIDYLGLNDVTIARSPVDKRRVFGHEHRGTLEYLERRGVEVFDATNHLVQETPIVSFRSEKLEPLRESWKNLRLGDRYMTFATFLSDEEFEARLGHVERSADSVRGEAPPRPRRRTPGTP